MKTINNIKDLANELSKTFPFEIIKTEKSDRSEASYLIFKNQGNYKRIRLASHDATAQFSKCEYEFMIIYRPANSYLNSSDKAYFEIDLEEEDDEIVYGETETADTNLIIKLITRYIIEHEEAKLVAR